MITAAISMPCSTRALSVPRLCSSVPKNMIFGNVGVIVKWLKLAFLIERKECIFLVADVVDKY